MSTLTLPSFDTLAYVKRLKDADVPEKQAEAQAEALRAVFSAQDLATKEGLRELEASTDSKFGLLRKDMDLLRKDLYKDMDLLRKDLHKDMDALRQDIIIKLGSMVIGTGIVLIAAIGALAAFLNR